MILLHVFFAKTKRETVMRWSYENAILVEFWFSRCSARNMTSICSPMDLHVQLHANSSHFCQFLVT